MNIRRNMRIGIFTECYKPIINGVVNSILGFKQGFEALGHEVYVFCPTYINHKDDLNDKNIIHLQSWPLPGKSGYHYVFPLSQEIKNIAKTMDIIHVQHPFIMGQRALKISQEFNIPIIFTNHTQYDQYTHYIPFSKSIVLKSIVKYIIKFTANLDLIIAPAQGIKKKLESYGVKTPIEIVPNGIDTKRFEKEVSKKEINKILERYKLDIDWPVLIYTGRIAEEKNLIFLLKAFQELVKDYPETYLMLIGGGVQIDYFTNLIKELNLKENVFITGFIPYEEVQNYLALGKIYVTASKSEVHPLTLLEAMAQGLPPVIIDAPGTGDIVTDMKDGLKTKDNIKDFIKKIQLLLINKKLHNILSKGAKETAEKYSIPETSKRLLEVYEKVMKSHN